MHIAHLHSIHIEMRKLCIPRCTVKMLILLLLIAMKHEKNFFCECVRLFLVCIFVTTDKFVIVYILFTNLNVISKLIFFQCTVNKLQLPLSTSTGLWSRYRYQSGDNLGRSNSLGFLSSLWFELFSSASPPTDQPVSVWRLAIPATPSTSVNIVYKG